MYVERTEKSIVIRQDFVGCYGLYLFRDGEYWAISNCFQYLVDHIKQTHRITLNKQYGDSLLLGYLAALSVSETLINEIERLDRAAVVTIDVATKTISTTLADYGEDSLEIDTPEGMAALDAWFCKWTGIIRGLRYRTTDITTALSGGFDSRITLTLFLGSGIDMDGVHVRSSTDGLHCHAEDLEIAQGIASEYGFRLNDSSRISRGVTVNASVRDTLSNSLDLKLGVHTQMYWKPTRFNVPRFYFTGNGVRHRDLTSDLKSWSTEETLISTESQRFKCFGSEAVESVRAILKRSFARVHEKYTYLGRPLDLNKAGIALYVETRNRFHYGLAQATDYCASRIFTLSPLEDSDLFKLKNNSSECPDQNLLISVIFDRYCSGLLNHKIEGKRSIAPATIEFARMLNRKHPFRARMQTAPEEFVMPAIQHEEQTTNPPLSADAIREYIKSAYFSSNVKTCFEAMYSPKTYLSLAEYWKKTKFFPDQKSYAAIAVCKAHQDCTLGPCPENNETAADFVLRRAQEARCEAAAGSSTLSA